MADETGSREAGDSNLSSSRLPPRRDELLRGTATSPSVIRLSVVISRRINFAMQQNDVPVLQRLRVENISRAPIRSILVRITAEPAFAVPVEVRIEMLAPASICEPPADLHLAPQYLWDVTESLRGLVRFEVYGEDGGTEEPVSDESAEALNAADRADASTAATRNNRRPPLLLTHCEPIEILAKDEWPGLSLLPEILAAFVLPNHPGVEKTIRVAADLLEEWTRDPSLCGYQTKDPKRIYMMVAAIYGALQKADITYANPLPSFEEEGQRIRLPDRILSGRVATCLDMATLACSCIEHAGLHSIVVLVEGHAFAGVWMREECFPEPTVTEPLTLRKRVDLQEIIVFDPTLVTSRPYQDFEAAVRRGRQHLELPEEFRCSIDVKRSRKAQIRPLPENVPQQEAGAASADAISHSASAPSVPAFDTRPLMGETASVASAASGDETPAARIDRWCRRLLDLSLRNRLLNFRDSKKTIPLMIPDLARLEDALARESTFRIRSRPEEFGPSDPRDLEAYRRRTGNEAIDSVLRDELGAGRLYADLSEDELSSRLLETYRAANLGIEEGGASALYLAVGLLKWYEAESSDKPHYAPILLLPIELHRPSAREGFSLRQSGDEPQLNVTMIEMLRRDHALSVTGLEPLPEDESGIDVRLVFRTIRDRIKDIPRWDVLETARIGIFSFAKFLMWRDLNERIEDLIRNPIVDHLVNRPGTPFDPGGFFPDPDRLDEERPAVETFCPVPADGSQLAAVFAAVDGRSFVLHGPPGTGKSQTITNVIAHCLAEGKTILFVSEKMAALQVVQKRLQDVGLGRFCLELHSNKAQKTEVLSQLSNVLDESAEREPAEWTREAARLDSLRKELNGYVKALHRPRASGESVFDAISRLIELKDAPSVKLTWSSVDEIDPDRLQALRDSVQALATIGTTLGGIADHAWTGVLRTNWSLTLDRDVRAALVRLGQAIASLESCARVIAGQLGIRESAWSHSDLGLMQEIAGKLLHAPQPPKAILVRPDWHELSGTIGTWIEHGRKRDALREALFAHYEPVVLELDHNALLRQLQEADRSWFLSAWWKRRAVRKALRAAAKVPSGKKLSELKEAIERAATLQKEETALSTDSDAARALLGRYWNNGEADWSTIEGIREWAQSLRGLAHRAAVTRLEAPVESVSTSGNVRSGRSAAELLDLWAGFAIDSVTPECQLGRDFLAYQESYVNFQRALSAVANLLETSADEIYGSLVAADALGIARSRVARWQAAVAELRDWCTWRRRRTEAVNLGLGPLIGACEAGQVSTAELKRAFDRSYYEWWHTTVVSQEPILAEFFSVEHQMKIESFRNLDDLCMKLAKQVIAARLASRVPQKNVADTLRNSEMGTLRREIAKRRRQMPIRRLVQEIPRVLPKLKPCLLMSPMSVAQYLDPRGPSFDLVVFDEASQIPVWDAIGAISRGRQAVIVGDPKQLPPTSFFQRADEADEGLPDEESVEDLESILDDCLAGGLPSLHLRWHYRSRHESLIAFSNFQYYDNRLLVFPSPQRGGMGVQLIPVPNGVYDRGKSATNRVEANALVTEVVRRIKDPALRRWSMGIVTFSLQQQRLIEELVEAARFDDREVDAYLAEGAPEGLFVKNLENVQGDERDVILFSICYGPDSLGRVALNFGPVNRDGGERRLNVAITRARREVLVFSTLRSEQIDLARTRARGVRDLKTFLEYAEKGTRALASAAAARGDPSGDFESPFEEAVCRAIEGNGWEVHRQVGCAYYRIDLAVVHPEEPGRYLVGIECDGANYHSAKLARDRDKLREGVLRGLGWRIFRVWSTDWWLNPQREIEKIEAVLQDALAGVTRRAAAPASEESTSRTPVPEGERRGESSEAGTGQHTDLALPSVQTDQVANGETDTRTSAFSVAPPPTIRNIQPKGVETRATGSNKRKPSSEGGNEQLGFPSQ